MLYLFTHHHRYHHHRRHHRHTQIYSVPITVEDHRCITGFIRREISVKRATDIQHVRLL